MDLLSWNILSGGFNSYTNSSPRPERLSGLIDAVHKANADFVSLVDTFRWTEVFTSDELKNLFGYPHVYSIKLNDQRLMQIGHDNGITVLTRTPNPTFETVWLSTRNAIKTQTEIKGKKIDIFSIYLDDLSEDARLRQIQALFDLIHPTTSTIFLGDLNTFDDQDLTETRWNLEKLPSRIPKSLESSLNEMLKAQVTKWIKSHNFKDLGAKSGFTVPAKLFPISVSGSLARIDYAFGSPDFKIKSFTVLTTEPYASLSDHFPIHIQL